MSKLAALRELRIAKEAYVQANDAFSRVPLDGLAAKGLRDLMVSVSALIRSIEQLMLSVESD
jgi:hypothetical protein